jgi:uncharacterized cupredoxin-like copper-binding protein
MKFRSIAVMVLMILTASIVLSACGGSAPATGGGKTISVDAAEFTFAPNKLDAKVGEKLTFKITNKGTLDHSFVVADAGGTVIGRIDVKIGGSASLDFTPSKAGTYQFYCDVPGHKESGMIGTINAQ